LNTTSTFALVIPAAGIGTRMQSEIPKQYLSLLDKTVIEHSIAAFIDHPLISQIVVCLHEQDAFFKQLKIASHPKIKTVVGGATRADSVLSGLHYLQNNTEENWVLVHDAARPGLSQSALNRLIAARDNHDGAILAMPLIDTIKQARKPSGDMKGNVIEKTVDRNQIWAAQTPQMFNINALIESLKKATEDNVSITDEASAMEYCGLKVALVEGEAANLKITRPEDLAIAGFYIEQAMLQQETQKRDNS
jgi:2-C-methyl-D-erythritol 4-phosphate cytidylyltransferase